MITDHKCKCRHDLGLNLLSYSSTYTCYTNYDPNKACACPSDEYWSGEKCVEKKKILDYCVDSCQCKEDLGLSCQTYVNGYSCFASFALGKRCLCNQLTHWWSNGQKKCGKLIFEEKKLIN